MGLLSPHFSCLLLWGAESVLLDSTVSGCGVRQPSASFWTESWTCYTISVSLFLLRASCLISKCAGHKTTNQPLINCSILDVAVGKDLCQCIDRVHFNFIWAQVMENSLGFGLTHHPHPFYTICEPDRRQ